MNPGLIGDMLLNISVTPKIKDELIHSCCVCVCVCLCVCVCVCVHAHMHARVCVCLYPSTVKVSSICNNILDILQGTDQQPCVEGILPHFCQVPASQFLDLLYDIGMI